MARSSRPTYGVDAPYVPVAFAVCALIAVSLSGIVMSRGGTPGFLWAVAVLFVVMAALYLHTTLRGKFLVWRELLDALELRGQERVVDLGCGRGAVLLAAAERVPRGRVTGVDLWRTKDQSGNAEEVTARNAELAGCRDRVELVTGNLTSLPLPDGCADVVLSSLAVHNINDPADRDRAIDEALRILRPGGRLLIADISATKQYVSRLGSRLEDVRRRGLGWRFWWGGPWVATSLVTATKTRTGPGGDGAVPPPPPGGGPARVPNQQGPDRPGPGQPVPGGPPAPGAHPDAPTTRIRAEQARGVPAAGGARRQPVRPAPLIRGGAPLPPGGPGQPPRR